MKQYLPTDPAGKYVNLESQTMRALRLNGRGPKYIRVSRNKVVYDIEDLDAWLAAKKFSSTSEETSRRTEAGK
jgi:hypothetical protein